MTNLQNLALNDYKYFRHTYLPDYPPYYFRYGILEFNVPLDTV